jgi:tubulin-specific chaperone A
VVSKEHKNGEKTVAGEKGCLSREKIFKLPIRRYYNSTLARIMTTTTTDQQQLLRQLKIKTGVLRRLSKEQKMYEREVLDFNNAIIASSSDGAPPSQQMQCLEESKAMVRDTSVRLEKAFVDLEELVESASREEGENIAEKEEFVNAKAMVEEVKPSLT